MTDKLKPCAVSPFSTARQVTMPRKLVVTDCSLITCLK